VVAQYVKTKGVNFPQGVGINDDMIRFNAIFFELINQLVGRTPVKISNQFQMHVVLLSSNRHSKIGSHGAPFPMRGTKDLVLPLFKRQHTQGSDQNARNTTAIEK
jgi:hypothetical protein